MIHHRRIAVAAFFFQYGRNDFGKLIQYRPAVMLTGRVRISAITVSMVNSSNSRLPVNQNFGQMLAIFCDITRDVRHFNHVIGDKGRQRFHSRELVCFMEREIDAINANTMEELVFFQ